MVLRFLLETVWAALADAAEPLRFFFLPFGGGTTGSTVSVPAAPFNFFLALKEALGGLLASDLALEAFTLLQLCQSTNAMYAS